MQGSIDAGGLAEDARSHVKGKRRAGPAALARLPIDLLKSDGAQSTEALSTVAHSMRA
jgi:hypothetical protein